jgi:hypothetical protein
MLNYIRYTEMGMREVLRREVVQVVRMYLACSNAD